MNFDLEVLEKSQEVPVVVDFWAPWCGPCQFLGPVIEDLATEARGRWQLVKVNTDEHPEISEKYQIRGIPAVKMFSKGEVIAEFTGALPRPQLEAWLDQYLPDERKKVLAAIMSKGPESNLDELREFVSDHPDFIDGKVALARQIAFDDPSTALDLVSQIRTGEKYYDSRINIETVKDLLDLEVKGTGDLEEKLKAVQHNLLSNDIEQAIRGLIEMVQMNRNYHNDLPRLATIAIFNLLGFDHELTKEYRKKFDMSLY